MRIGRVTFAIVRQEPLFIFGLPLFNTALALVFISHAILLDRLAALLGVFLSIFSFTLKNALTILEIVTPLNFLPS